MQGGHVERHTGGEGVKVGKQKLFQWASQISSRPVTSVDDLKDGVVLLRLFRHIWPNHMQQRAHRVKADPHFDSDLKINWELLKGCLSDAGVPLSFVDQKALQAGKFKAGYNALVLSFFLYNLGRDHDFAVDFYQPIDSRIASFLQSGDCIQSLINGGSLSVPPEMYDAFAETVNPGNVAEKEKKAQQRARDQSQSPTKKTTTPPERTKEVGKTPPSQSAKKEKAVGGAGRLRAKKKFVERGEETKGKHGDSFFLDDDVEAAEEEDAIFQDQLLLREGKGKRGIHNNPFSFSLSNEGDEEAGEEGSALELSGISPTGFQVLSRTLEMEEERNTASALPHGQPKSAQDLWAAAPIALGPQSQQKKTGGLPQGGGGARARTSSVVSLAKTAGARLGGQNQAGHTQQQQQKSLSAHQQTAQGAAGAEGARSRPVPRTGSAVHAAVPHPPGPSRASAAPPPSRLNHHQQHHPAGSPVPPTRGTASHYPDPLGLSKESPARPPQPVSFDPQVDAPPPFSSPPFAGLRRSAASLSRPVDEEEAEDEMVERQRQAEKAQAGMSIPTAASSVPPHTNERERERERAGRLQGIYRPLGPPAARYSSMPASPSPPPPPREMPSGFYHREHNEYVGQHEAVGVLEGPPFPFSATGATAEPEQRPVRVVSQADVIASSEWSEREKGRERGEGEQEDGVVRWQQEKQAEKGVPDTTAVRATQDAPMQRIRSVPSGVSRLSESHFESVLGDGQEQEGKGGGGAHVAPAVSPSQAAGGGSSSILTAAGGLGSWGADQYDGVGTQRLLECAEDLLLTARGESGGRGGRRGGTASSSTWISSDNRQKGEWMIAALISEVSSLLRTVKRQQEEAEAVSKLHQKKVRDMEEQKRMAVQAAREESERTVLLLKERHLEDLHRLRSDCVSRVRRLEDVVSTDAEAVDSLYSRLERLLERAEKEREEEKTEKEISGMDQEVECENEKGGGLFSSLPSDRLDLSPDLDREEATEKRTEKSPPSPNARRGKGTNGATLVPLSLSPKKEERSQKDKKETGEVEKDMKKVMRLCCHHFVCQTRHALSSEVGTMARLVEETKNSMGEVQKECRRVASLSADRWASWQRAEELVGSLEASVQRLESRENEDRKGGEGAAPKTRGGDRETVQAVKRVLEAFSVRSSSLSPLERRLFLLCDELLQRDFIALLREETERETEKREGGGGGGREDGAMGDDENERRKRCKELSVKDRRHPGKEVERRQRQKRARNLHVMRCSLSDKSSSFSSGEDMGGEGETAGGREEKGGKTRSEALRLLGVEELKRLRSKCGRMERTNKFLTERLSLLEGWRNDPSIPLLECAEEGEGGEEVESSRLIGGAALPDLSALSVSLQGETEGEAEGQRKKKGGMKEDEEGKTMVEKCETEGELLSLLRQIPDAPPCSCEREIQKGGEESNTLILSASSSLSLSNSEWVGIRRKTAVRLLDLYWRVIRELYRCECKLEGAKAVASRLAEQVQAAETTILQLQQAHRGSLRSMAGECETKLVNERFKWRQLLGRAAVELDLSRDAAREAETELQNHQDAWAKASREGGESEHRRYRHTLARLRQLEFERRGLQMREDVWKELTRTLTEMVAGPSVERRERVTELWARLVASQEAVKRAIKGPEAASELEQTEGEGKQPEGGVRELSGGTSSSSSSSSVGAVMSDQVRAMVEEASASLKRKIAELENEIENTKGKVAAAKEGTKRALEAQARERAARKAERDARAIVESRNKILSGETASLRQSLETSRKGERRASLLKETQQSAFRSASTELRTLLALRTKQLRDLKRALSLSSAHHRDSLSLPAVSAGEAERVHPSEKEGQETGQEDSLKATEESKHTTVDGETQRHTQHPAACAVRRRGVSQKQGEGPERSNSESSLSPTPTARRTHSVVPQVEGRERQGGVVERENIDRRVSGVDGQSSSKGRGKSSLARSFGLGLHGMLKKSQQKQQPGEGTREQTEEDGDRYTNVRQEEREGDEEEPQGTERRRSPRVMPSSSSAESLHSCNERKEEKSDCASSALADFECSKVTLRAASARSKSSQQHPQRLAEEEELLFEKKQHNPCQREREGGKQQRSNERGWTDDPHNRQHNQNGSNSANAFGPSQTDPVTVRRYSFPFPSPSLGPQSTSATSVAISLGGRQGGDGGRVGSRMTRAAGSGGESDAEFERVSLSQPADTLTDRAWGGQGELTELEAEVEGEEKNGALCVSPNAVSLREEEEEENFVSMAQAGSTVLSSVFAAGGRGRGEGEKENGSVEVIERDGEREEDVHTEKRTTDVEGEDFGDSLMDLDKMMENADIDRLLEMPVSAVGSGVHSKNGRGGEIGIAGLGGFAEGEGLEGESDFFSPLARRLLYGGTTETGVQGGGGRRGQERTGVGLGLGQISPPLSLSGLLDSPSLSPSHSRLMRDEGEGERSTKETEKDRRVLGFRASVPRSSEEMEMRMHHHQEEGQAANWEEEEWGVAEANSLRQKGMRTQSNRPSSRSVPVPQSHTDLPASQGSRREGRDTAGGRAPASPEGGTSIQFGGPGQSRGGIGMLSETLEAPLPALRAHACSSTRDRLSAGVAPHRMHLREKEKDRTATSSRGMNAMPPQGHTQKKPPHHLPVTAQLHQQQMHRDPHSLSSHVTNHGSGGSHGLPPRRASAVSPVPVPLSPSLGPAQMGVPGAAKNWAGVGGRSR